MLILYVVCLLFYHRLIFVRFVSIFVFLHLLRLGEGTNSYFAISWFSCSCNSALFGKYNW